MNKTIVVTAVLVCKSTSGGEFNDQDDQISTTLIFSSAHSGSKTDQRFRFSTTGEVEVKVEDMAR